MHPRLTTPWFLVLLTAVCWAEGTPATQPAAPADEAPILLPADLDGKTLPPPEPAAAPATPPPGESSSRKAQSPDEPLTVQQQLAIFDQLQQRILKLQYQLQQAQEQNERLTAALLESREAAGNLQGELNRAAILRQIQNREVQELRDQVAAMNQATPRQDAPAPTTQPGDEVDRVDALVELGRLRRENEKLHLQLQLAAIEDSDEKNRKLLTQLQETTKTLQKVEALRRQLSSLVVTQADEVRALRERQKLMETQIAELRSAPPAAVPRPAPSTVATPAPPAAVENIAVVAPEPLDPLAAAATPTADPQPLTPPSPEPERIIGKITELGDVAIVINIGAGGGVKRGMRLIVFREDMFIGYLDVTHVKDGEAAGTMSLRIREPQVGDNVIDRLE